MAEMGGQQLFDLWKRQVEEGSQAWLRTLGQGQPADPQSFWRPFMDQGMAAWSKVMTQGPPSADLMGQWKQFLDQWIAAWSKVLEQAMGTETFAQAMASRWRASSTRRAGQEGGRAADRRGARGLGLPSRSQVIGVAAQSCTRDKVDGLEDRLDAVVKELRGADGGCQCSARVIGLTLDTIEVGDGRRSRGASDAESPASSSRSVTTIPCIRIRRTRRRRNSKTDRPGDLDGGPDLRRDRDAVARAGAILLSQDLKFLRR